MGPIHAAELNYRRRGKAVVLKTTETKESSGGWGQAFCETLISGCSVAPLKNYFRSEVDVGKTQEFAHKSGQPSRENKRRQADFIAKTVRKLAQRGSFEKRDPKEVRDRNQANTRAKEPRVEI